MKENQVIFLNEKKYRCNVGIILMSAHYPEVCEFFLGERHDLAGVWQFPQGGIDEGETPKQALLRELEEEVGTSEVEIIAEYPEWVHYDFPVHIANKMRPYDGQIQKYFLVKLKRENVINIHTKEPEFAQHKFVDYKTLLHEITSFKRDVYCKVLSYFRKEGYI